MADDQIVDEPTMAIVIYILYLLGYVTGISALAGVIIAHIQKSSSSDYVSSHYEFQIWTFWIWLAYLIVGVVLTMVLVGYVILGWWILWSLIRTIKGLLAINKRQPISNPHSWLFG